MNKDEPNTPLNAPPHHPLFNNNQSPASFNDCIEAIDRVRSIIAIYDFVKLGDDRGGLSSDAVLGCHWINTMNRETLAFVCDRLVELHRQSIETQRYDSAYLSAWLSALNALGREHRERFLSHVASHMNIPRSSVDQFVSKKTTEQR